MENEADRGQDTKVDQPNDSTAETGAQDELEQLLQEYEKDVPKGEPQAPKQDKPVDTKAITEQVMAQVRLEAETEKALGEATRAVKGDLKVSDRVIRAYLDERARENPAIAKLFVDRNKNPGGYNKLLSKLAKDFKSDIGADIDQEATRDREALANAVRGASNKVPESDEGFNSKQLEKASDAEFNKKLRELGI